jgi:arylsulfatase A-like enzyme
MRFTDAHSPSAVCTPTRYSVLTGRYAWRSWLKNFVLMEHMPLLIATDRMTVPSMLKRHGYTTGCFGKWHLGWGNSIHPAWEEQPRPGPLEVGFDTFFGVPHSHNSSPRLQVFMEGRNIVGLREGESLDNKETLARVQRDLEDTAVTVSERAVQFIRDNAKSPFFLYYPATNVHVPHTPHPRFKGKSRVGAYGDSVVEFDWAVGEVMAELDRQGIADNTLLIVTSDNGAKITADWCLNGHSPNGPWRSGKASIYEGGHRVPLIARWPGVIDPGTTTGETVCLTDLMATCAAIAGQELPDNAAEDSFSLVPVLRGDKRDGPVRPATIHHSVDGTFAIRQGKWKYIDAAHDGYHPTAWKKAFPLVADKPVRNPQTGRFEDLHYHFPKRRLSPGQMPGQLYNLETDPGETTNLFAKRPEVVERLKSLLQQCRHTGGTARPGPEHPLMDKNNPDKGK